MKNLILFIIILVPIILWLIYSYIFLYNGFDSPIILKTILEDKALVGDSFGALTSLFSGLAVSGILISLYLQQKEFESIRKIQSIDIFENRFFEFVAKYDTEKNIKSFASLFRYLLLKHKDIELEKYSNFIEIKKMEHMKFLFIKKDTRDLEDLKKIIEKAKSLQYLTLQNLFNENYFEELELLFLKKEAYGNNNKILDLYDFLEKDKNNTIEKFFTELKIIRYKIIIKRSNLKLLPNLENLFNKMLEELNIFNGIRFYKYASDKNLRYDYSTYGRVKVDSNNNDENRKKIIEDIKNYDKEEEYPPYQQYDISIIDFKKLKLSEQNDFWNKMEDYLNKK
jgi:hypothetical protein